jgi:hypothetical protein
MWVKGLACLGVGCERWEGVTYYAIMAPAEFMDEIVVPTPHEFRDEWRLQRRAYLACIAVFHLKDHHSGRCARHQWRCAVSAFRFDRRRFRSGQ